MTPAEPEGGTHFSDPVGEFLDAGTDYVLLLIDARTATPVYRANIRIIESKERLRQKLVNLLASANSSNIRESSNE